jgi:hypothetical protein
MDVDQLADAFGDVFGHAIANLAVFHFLLLSVLVLSREALEIAVL